MIDKEEIVRALKLWFQPGDVFEVRVLKAVTGGYLKPHTESGYFDYEHIPSAADAIGKVRAYAGAYVTINPVASDLLARAYNCLCPAESESTTADSDIVRRRWLLIDCDAVRKAKISSTDAEHDAALTKAREIRDGLSSLGWPMPVLLDSGNGAQMTYKIDLPADDGGLVQRVITEIAKASSDAVKVDLTVYNPARIWRIPGTMNCKGDANGAKVGRPHRMAHILEVPDNLTAVTEAQLRSVAGETTAPVALPETESGYAESDGFDLDEWVAKFAPDAGQPVPYKDGRKWIFKVCPFNPAHDNSSAGIFQSADGKIGFRCHHDGCRGNDWKKFRVLREPGCYDRPRADNLPTVDVTGILNQQSRKQGGTETEKKENSDFKSPGEIPAEMLHIPGFVEEYVNFIMASAPYPNRSIAFCAALAFLAFLAGRTVKDERNNRTNIYLVVLAQPGSGKEHPRQVNTAVAMRCGLGASVADAFGSGQGLEDAMFAHPSMLFQVDEFDTVFNALKNDKDGKGEPVMEKLLRFYGASRGIFKMRKLAAKRQDGGKTQSGDDDLKIINPNLSIFGTAIPKFFYESLGLRVLLNGLSARCLILDSGRRGRGNAHMVDIDNVPPNIASAVEIIKKYGSENNLHTEFPSPMLIRAMPDAAALLRELNDNYDNKYDYYEERKEAVPMAFWGRAFEKVCKLSMLYAISENVKNPFISVAGIRWAESFVDFLTAQMLYMVDAYSFENAFDEKSRKVLRYIVEAGKPIAHAALLKKSHESAETLKQIIDTLMENGSITMNIVGEGVKTTRFYEPK
ncbi:MAG: hypothetical protein BWY31_04632 [Lentisphaerae bacterium ADurb.Bin242]|nr:MAG: hypothetical protein BWY31_04632 [Lentisphaerae bacterium ADurb.Bin242]